MVRNCKKNKTQNSKTSLQKSKNLSWEPAREARRRPRCCFELRRAKRAGARPRPNKKVLAPESGPQIFNKIHLAPGSLGEIFLLEARGVLTMTVRFYRQDALTAPNLAQRGPNLAQYCMKLHSRLDPNVASTVGSRRRSKGF